MIVSRDVGVFLLLDHEGGTDDAVAGRDGRAGHDWTEAVVIGGQDGDDADGKDGKTSSTKFSACAFIAKREREKSIKIASKTIFLDRDFSHVTEMTAPTSSFFSSRLETRRDWSRP